MMRFSPVFVYLKMKDITPYEDARFTLSDDWPLVVAVALG